MSITWLASYPKSGNSWVRALLSNYFSGADGPVHINAMLGGSIQLSRHGFEEAMGVSPNRLRPAELVRLRAIYHQNSLITAAAPSVPFFVKTHERYGDPDERNPLLTGSPPRRAIYCIRHPFDVAVSYAHHRGTSFEDTVEFMNDREAVLSGGALFFDERLGSWSDHALEWSTQPHVHIWVVRYEDLITDPIDTVSAILSFAGIEVSRDRVAKSVEYSSFELLRQQEIEGHFRERHAKAASFFRAGRTGDGDNLLSEDLKNIVRARHGEAMAKFGYV